MNSYLTLVSAAALVLATAGLPDAAIGQTTTETAADALLQRPTVDFAAFRENQLHLGMTAAEVASNWSNYVENCAGCAFGGYQNGQRQADAVAIYQEAISAGWG